MTETQTARATLDRELALATIGGDPIAVRASTLVVRATDDGELSCRLHVSLPFADFQRAVAEGLFGLDAPGRGPGDLETGTTVDLTLTLRDYLVQRLAADGGLLEAVLQALLEPGAIDLRHADAWRALEVLQAVDVPEELGGDDAVVRTGFRTAWANAGTSAASTEMIDVVRTVLDDRSVAYELVDPHIIRAPMISTDGATWILLIRVAPDDGYCVAYAVHPGRIPEERRPGAALTLAAVNYELPVGAFELDPSDGEVRFRTGLDVGDEALPASAVERLLDYNTAIMAAQLDVLDSLCAAL